MERWRPALLCRCCGEHPTYLLRCWILEVAHATSQCICLQTIASIPCIWSWIHYQVILSWRICVLPAESWLSSRSKNDICVGTHQSEDTFKLGIESMRLTLLAVDFWMAFWSATVMILSPIIGVWRTLVYDVSSSSRGMCSGLSRAFSILGVCLRGSSIVELGCTSCSFDR